MDFCYVAGRFTYTCLSSFLETQKELIKDLPSLPSNLFHAGTGLARAGKAFFKYLMLVDEANMNLPGARERLHQANHQISNQVVGLWYSQ